MTRHAEDARDPLPPLGGVLGLVRLLHDVDRGLQRMSGRTRAALGVSAAQRLVLRLVGRFPGVTAGRLAAVLGVHPGTVTGVVRGLARRGLLRRTVDRGDRRRAFLALTPAGRRLDAVAAETVESALRSALDGLPPGKIAATREVLVAIAAALATPASR